MSFMLVVKTAVHGYDVYRTVWEPHLDEEFIVIQESGNSHDRNATSTLALSWGIYHEKFL